MSATHEVPDHVQGALVPIAFDGDPLEVVTTTDGNHWVVLAALCAPFEIKDTWEQARKLKKLAWAQTGKITVWANGLRRQLFCIHLRSIAGWLFTLNPGKIAERVRPKLLRYQRDCADYLADRLLGPRQTPALPGREDASALTWARLREELDARDARLREAWQQDHLKMLEHISKEIRVTVRAAVSPWAELVMALAARQQYLEKALGTKPAEPTERASAPTGKGAAHAEVLRNLSARELARRLKTPPLEERAPPKPQAKRRANNQRPDTVRQAALQLLAQGHSQRETIAILAARGMRCSRGSLGNWQKASAPQDDPSTPSRA